jgi:phospholipase/carboxylesterase
MNAPLLPCVEVEPSASPTASVIWLHGLGADGNDFVPALPYLGLPAEHGIRFVLPTATAIPVTINGGMVMPAWYDIRDMDLAAEDRNDSAGLLRSVASVRALVTRERARGIPSERIILVGFSQGGAVAIELALTHDERLGGLVALSTYVVDRERIENTRQTCNRELPILQCHGLFDPMVPPASGEAARDFLRGLGYDPLWCTYPIEHEVSPRELVQIGSFLGARLC